MWELWQNLKTGFAFKSWWLNLKNHTWLTLRNELCPSWWVTGFDGWFGPSMKQEALYGWCGLHLGVALALAVGLGINWWQMALIALGIEVFQFCKAYGSFVNPINSLLDIGSYTLWVFLYTKYIGWSFYSIFGN